MQFKKYITICVFIFFVLLMSSCFESGKTIVLSTPNVENAERLFYWEKVENANEYVVFVNGEELTTIKDTFYVVPSEHVGKMITVAAKADTTLSNKSDPITVANIQSDLTVTSFDELKTHSEKINIGYRLNYEYSFLTIDFSNIQSDLTEEFTLIIPTSAKKLKVKGNQQYVVKKFNIGILARDTDFILILENIRMEGADESMNAITLDTPTAGKSGRLIVETIGTANNIKAGNVTKLPGEGSSNTGFLGGAASSGNHGYPGGHGIKADYIVIYGDANLYVSGGTGGNGGDGGSSSGIAGQGGNGGNGGKGGNGITATTVIVSLPKDRSLNLAGGGGGIGGKKGTGIWGSPKDGQNGARGVGSSAEITRLSGVVSK